MPCIGINVVGAKACLEQLGGGIALPYRPLAGAEHAHRVGALGLERLFELLCHDVEGRIPGNLLELAILGIATILHAQQRLCQTITAIHDLGQEVTFDAVQSPVDLGLRVTLSGHYAVVLDGHHDAATCTAKAAWSLGPLQVGSHCSCILGQSFYGDACNGPCGCGRRLTDKITPSASHVLPLGLATASSQHADKPGMR